MKANFALLTLFTLASAALSACGHLPATSALPMVQSFHAAPVQHRAAAGQFQYASEMRGFSSIQNPMRTMLAEYTTADGQKMRMQADRFLKSPTFNLSVGPEDSHQQTQYFASTDKAKVQALLNALQALDTQAVDANNQAALGRILDHLKSAL